MHQETKKFVTFLIEIVTGTKPAVSLSMPRYFSKVPHTFLMFSKKDPIEEIRKKLTIFI